MPVQFPAVIELSDLNGKNGFVINGFNANGISGITVASMGDINGDGMADALIGARYNLPNDYGFGQTYVIFGSQNVGNSGTFQLSSLDGNNGFSIQGSPAHYAGEFSISSAGDINGDGIDDLLIGNYSASPNGSLSGQSYVIFGNKGIGASGILQISSLNGGNGFSIDGIGADNFSGISVSYAGDINADGFADVLIGAFGASPNGHYSGQSYVIFGGSAIGSSGNIQLSGLNGSNGFFINGITSGDKSGHTVSAAGDINDDGITDIFIGAPSASLAQGYVIFGASGIGSSGTLELSSLNGSNGFAINGIVAGNNQIMPASQGDINDDGIDDLILGSPGDGQSYVVFGSPLLNDMQLIQLSSLNGTNGLTINDVNLGYGSGVTTIACAGDVNGDGIADVVIGANYASPNGHWSGQSYVVFGGKDVGSAGVFQLSSLDGSNGFSINGVAPGVLSGIVSGAGDINDDGVSDVLIGACHASPNGQPDSGQSYVVFGQNPSMLVLNNNQLAVNQGQTVTITQADLKASSSTQPADTLQFYITAIEYGQFAFIENPSVPINVFFQQNITDGQIQFTQDGTLNPPSYSVSVECEALFARSFSASANVAFTPCDMKFVNNVLTINQEQTVILGQSNLYATSNPCPQDDMQFQAQSVQHGQFEFVQNPSVAITAFSQQNVTDGAVQFVQDGSANAPIYSMQAYLSEWASTSSELADVNFTPCNMALVNNMLTINQGQTVILGQSNLYATSNPCPQDDMQFQVQSVQHGQFEFVQNPSVAVTTFSQQNVTEGAVQFVQDGSGNAPGYSVQAYISQWASTSLEPGTINLGLFLLNNGFVINQAISLVLTNSSLLAENPLIGLNDQIIFTLHNVSYSQFSRVSNPSISLASFTQADINAGQIQFVTDGTSNAPSYSFTVSDSSYMIPTIQNGNIVFHYAPVITVNALTINQGETVLLNNKIVNLKATDAVTPAVKLIFNVSGIQYGYFSLVGNSQTILTNFTQGQVDNVAIQFVQDGSPNAPSYNVSVINQFGAISKPQAAIINFSPNPSNNTAPPSPPNIIIHDAGTNNNLTRNILIGASVSGSVLIAGLLCYISMGYLKNSRLNAIAKNKSGDEKDYYQYTIIPISKEIFDTIKITGFMNYISQEKIKEYVAAIAKVVHEMSELGINIDLQDMPAEQKTLLVNQMIVEMKKALNLTKQGATRCSGFFKPQVTPEHIMEQAKAIATSVRESLFSGVSDTRINLPPGMESWQMGGKSSKPTGERTPLLSA